MFEDYVKLYLGTSTDTTRIYEKVNDRWEVCVSLTEGHFEQVFFNALIDNPAFDSQTKENLTTNKGSFGSTCELSEEFLKKVVKSDVVNRLLRYIDFKLNEKLKKTDGKRKGKLNIPKLEDVNLAASANSGDCTLILIEGDSAKALAMSGLSVVGQDQGKLLSVREATPKQLQENAEIQNNCMDHDGSHIKGLLINFIHSFWPSLLKAPNFMLEFITPIVKATNKKTKKVLSFNTMPEYEAWKESLGNKATKYKINESKEGAEYFADLDHHMKDFVWADDKDGDAIELAFSKKKIDAKERLEHFSWTNFDSKEKHIPYRNFFNKELILFSMANLQRSIPSMVDGLKPGQRKILFCAFKKPIIQEIKVAQFSGYVSEHSAYHHGEASLMGGKDHASDRYIFTQLSLITRYLFHKADELLLNYLNDDGQSIEPAWFIPIIPMVLVNGSEGIGTGWSSFIPNYNPRDIIANLKLLLNGEAMVPMHPWYKWFKGIIQKTTSKETGYTTIGIMEDKEDENTLSVTELPVRRWTQEYKEILEVAAQEGKDKIPFIKDYTAHTDDTTVHFEIIMTEDQMNTARQEGFLKKFKLTTTLSTSNVHLFDANGRKEEGKLDTSLWYMASFHVLVQDCVLIQMWSWQTALLRQLGKASLLLENKVRFIREVVEGTIVVSNKKKDDLYAELNVKDFTPLPKETGSIIAGAVDHVGREETEEEEEVAAGEER
ncbi:DNA topoisomerase 2 [Tanacetum coccineum]